MNLRIIFITVILSFNLSFQMKGQTVTATEEANSSVVNFKVSDLQDLTLNNHPDGHYQIFLSYGDGNYYRSEAEMVFNKPELNVDYSHTYLNIVNTYNPTTLLIKRKSDNPPPPPPSFQVMPPDNQPNQVNITPSNPDNVEDPISYTSSMFEYSDDSTFCRRLAMKHSHFLEDGEWSAFILGYRPMQFTEGGLFFFYDNENSNDIEELFTNVFSQGSKYGGYQMNTEDIESRNASSFIRDPNDIDNTKPIYDKVLYFPINADEGSIDVRANPQTIPEELRLFHFLKAKEFTKDFDYKFLAVLGSVRPDNKFCKEYNWNEDYDFLHNYIKPDINGNYLIKTNSSTSEESPLSFHYLDAVEYTTKTGDPKDPNEILITKVCDCSDGKYQVTFRLTYCNVSPVPTESATLFIKDLQNIFTCFSMPHPDYDNGDAPVRSNLNPDCVAANNKCLSKNFSAGTEAKFCAGSYSIADKSTNQPEEERCRKFEFTALIESSNWNDQTLQNPYIEACVNFHETECELVCSQNIPIKVNLDSILTLNFHPNTIDDCPTPCKNCKSKVTKVQPWAIAVAVAGIALLLLFFLRRKP